MSTQFYAPDQQAASRQVTSQPPAGQQATGTSWIRIWAVVIGTAVIAALVVLAVALWHGQSSATPATTGTSTSASPASLLPAVRDTAAAR
jgi:heme/copper-type cytochrome/quinol oxidase subunit 2